MTTQPTNGEQAEPAGQVPETRSGHRPGPAGPPRSDAGPSHPESRIRVTAWPDQVLDKLGHDPRSVYVERFWLPILGPSCLLLIRRLAAELERDPEGVDIETASLAREMGIGMKGGRHGPLWRAVERACRFGGARRNGERLAVRRRLPPLTARQIERLPESLRAAHDAWSQERLQHSRRPSVVRWTPHQTGRPEPEDGDRRFGDAA